MYLLLYPIYDTKEFNLYEVNTMNTSYSYDAYRAHDLNIAMRTSSGDEIKLDFANHQSTSFSQTKDENGSQTSLTFSSMQSFHFSIDSNGIDAQDKKEIEAFMKIAQPFIDEFLAEFESDVPGTPVTQMAKQITDIFGPMKEKDENTKNLVKTNLVDMFDNSFSKLEIPESASKETILSKIFEDSKKLLEKTLAEFDKLNKELYA